MPFEPGLRRAFWLLRVGHFGVVLPDGHVDEIEEFVAYIAGELLYFKEAVELPCVQLFIEEIYPLFNF
ncbi:hypothetical protein ACFQRK_23470 [Parapedobacter sp. GCM10030251]|uniref:hypothetical protein n=1 Tax=Parapedobacter sp. GCM10030251 TaxID=3273419 RepID=UPI00360C9A94